MITTAPVVIDRNDPDRTIFLIPEANMPRLEAEIAKLSRKAKKFADWTFDALIIGVQYRDNRDGSKTKVLEVSLDVEEIKIDGWKFLARLDHSTEGGTILRAVPNADVAVAERFRRAAPDCEHCNHRRLRRDTFVLFNETTGEYKQVGSTCLVDFLGHDARNLGRVAELAGYAVELARSAETSEQAGLQDRRYVDLVEYLEHSAAMVRIHGWVSSKAARENENLTATRMAALDNMLPPPNLRQYAAPITAADTATAAAALAWAQAFDDKDVLSDYEHNVLMVANSPVIEFRSTGIAASIVGVYVMKHTPQRTATDLGDMKEVLALLQNAGSRLRYPKINLNIPDVGDIVLSVATQQSKFPGSINVKSPGSYETSQWFGRISRDGTYAPSRTAPKGVEEGLLAFAADPAKMAAEHGHRTGRCCFCNIALKDKRSTEVGYGSTCAKNYNLPWGK